VIRSPRPSRTFATSSPSSSSTRSIPPPPVIVSFPARPESSFAAAEPTITSPNSEPLTSSTSERTFACSVPPDCPSLAWSSRLTRTAPLGRKVTLSMPGPPPMSSAPPLPVKKSPSSFPRSTSAPAEPAITSTPVPPFTVNGSDCTGMPELNTSWPSARNTSTRVMPRLLQRTVVPTGASQPTETIDSVPEFARSKRIFVASTTTSMLSRMPADAW
jgi:hypothetical protein